MSVEKMLGDGNCLFRSLSDQFFKDVGKKHKLVRSEVCKYLSEHIEWLRGFLADDIDINEYINKMRNDKVWGGDSEIAAAAIYYSRTITIFQDGFTNSRYSIGHNMREPPLKLLYTDGNHYASVIVENRLSVAMNTRHQARKVRHPGAGARSQTGLGKQGSTVEVII
jgi:hypothetical protein